MKNTPDITNDQKSRSGKRSLVVSLIGRPNVGKSSLFNRLMNSANKSITFDQPGVTRDRHYGITTIEAIAAMEPVEIILIDTGGFLPEVDNNLSGSEHDQKMTTFFNIMVDQAYEAIEESDLVLLVMDGREGMVPFDQLIADKIRERKKDFWAVVNKIDTDHQVGHELEFYGLGIDSEQLFPVSASHGRGVVHLKECLQQYVYKHDEVLRGRSNLQRGITPREKVVARLAIIGAPNAGKSTLLNRLLKAERALVSDIAGTTVDPIEGFFDLYFGPEVKELDDAIENSRVDNRQLITQYNQLRQSNPDIFSEGLMEYFDEAEALAAQEAAGLAELAEEEMAMDVESEFEAKSLDELESEIRDIDCLEEEESLEAAEEAREEELEGEREVELADESSQVEGDSNYWRSIHLVDTAGIRKAKKITEFIEAQSVYRALRCITESDIVLFMIDATKGISHQDRRLLDIALEKGKSVLVCLNKMDQMERKFKTPKDRKEWLADLQAYVPWLAFCELIPISAKHGRGLGRLKESIKKTILVRHKRLPTGELNRVLFQLFDQNPIYLGGSKNSSFKLKYASMVKSGPPTVMLFVNKSLGIPDNYRRFLVNGVRKHFELRNSPIHLIFRSGAKLEKDAAKH